MLTAHSHISVGIKKHKINDIIVLDRKVKINIVTIKILSF